MSSSGMSAAIAELHARHDMRRIACSSEVSSRKASLNASLAARISSIGASKSAVLPPAATVAHGVGHDVCSGRGHQRTAGKALRQVGVERGVEVDGPAEAVVAELALGVAVAADVEPAGAAERGSASSRQPLSVSTCSALRSFSPRVLSWTVRLPAEELHPFHAGVVRVRPGDRAEGGHEDLADVLVSLQPALDRALALKAANSASWSTVVSSRWTGTGRDAARRLAARARLPSPGFRRPQQRGRPLHTPCRSLAGSASHRRPPTAGAS